MKKAADISIFEFTVSRASLMKALERERAFFLLLGHVFNEVNILNKIALATDNVGKGTAGVESKAYAVQGMLLARLMIAKMHEGWEKLFKQLLFKGEFRRSYESALATDAKVALTELSRFFGGDASYVAAIRNGFAFHYPSEQLNAALPDIPHEEDWTIYLSSTLGNTLYYLSEMVAGHALLAAVGPDKEKAYSRILDDRNFLSARFLTLTTGCMNIFVKKYLALRRNDASEFQIKVPAFASFQMPYFGKK